jgi:DNA-directed RNA polymerase, mitochondrial
MNSIPRPELHTTDAEITIESLMAKLGRQRYRANASAAAKYGRQSETSSGKYLLREAVAKMVEGLTVWMADAAKRHGRAHAVSARFEDIGVDVVSFLAVKSVLDSIGRQSTLTVAAYALGNRVEEEAKFGVIQGQEPRMFQDLRRRLRRARGPQKRVKIIASAMAKIHATFEPWGRAEKIKAGVVLIELVRQTTGLIEIPNLSSPNGRRKAMVVATPETLAWLEKSHTAHEALFPFYLPTLVRPLDWVDDPWTGGYHTNLVLRRPVVKTRDEAYLLELARADMTEVYAATNALQSTAWEVNPDVLETMRFFWDAGTPIADLPERVDEARPRMPEGVEKGSDAYKAYRKQAALWHQRLVSSRSKRVLSAKIMFMAERFSGKRFYYPHQADFRGRLYPVPFFLQPQGPSQARGLLRFAVGAPITTSAAASWLAVHGANSFGVDKVSFDERVAWVTAHEREIRRVYEDPTENRWWAEAKKPWEFLAWCLEWVDFLDQGSGFVSRLPISMDGTNNGLQIFSLLMRDPVGAAATNVTHAYTPGVGLSPRDIYQDVADAVTVRLRTAADGGDDLARQWLAFLGPGGLPRAATKRQVMTVPYGSTFHACIHYTRDWYEVARREKGTTPFERGYDSSVYLAHHIWDAIGDVVGPARACMAWLRGVASALAVHDIAVRWTSPSGFPVKQGYMKYQTKQIATAIGETTRNTKYRLDTPEVARVKQMNGVSPNFVHSLDAAALVKTVNEAVRSGISEFMMIHDSFGVPAADAEKMATIIRAVYAEVFNDDLLERFREEVQGYAPEGVVIPAPPKGGGLDVGLVKDSPYFFA